ncbi:hypothetical protein ACFXP7_12275 [Microbacterium sp. P06]|uniref:hypothetical protein n=1 Tax=unclassified Microbacterium TaxID=2609290 RepID=UPI0037452C78
MTGSDDLRLPDLSGTVDERIAQLASIDEGDVGVSAEWLHRQLRSALAAWAEDETGLDIETEAREDY